MFTETQEVFHHYDGKPQPENVARCYAGRRLSSEVPTAPTKT
jgi:hypothetical protein